MNATAKKTDNTEDTGRKDASGRPLEIDPQWAQRQYDAGHVWTEWFIRLPEGCTLDDLGNWPGLWRKLQSSQHALQKLDRVLLVEFGEEWACEARVTAASGTGAELAIIKKFDMPKKYVVLPEDDDYKVKWYGNGYAVQRKRDGLKVSQVVRTLSEAERDMRMKHPRPV